MEDELDLEAKARLRPLAREKAAWFSGEIKKAAASKKNPHQVSIDLNDQIEVFVATLPEEERDIFTLLYIEELNANTAAMSDEADALLAKEAAGKANVASAISVIVAVVVFFVLMVLLV